MAVSFKGAHFGAAGEGLPGARAPAGGRLGGTGGAQVVEKAVVE